MGKDMQILRETSKVTCLSDLARDVLRYDAPQMHMVRESFDSKHWQDHSESTELAGLLCPLSKRSGAIPSLQREGSYSHGHGTGEAQSPAVQALKGA